MSLFEYRDGILYRRSVNRNGLKIGDPIGSTDVKGYLVTTINRKNYKIHRLIFLYHNGYMPEFIDHIDQNKSNNRIENLRPATKSQNMANRGSQNNNTSGYKGVCWHKRDRKWKAQIKINRKTINIGKYNDPIEAQEAYKKAALTHFKEFANI